MAAARALAVLYRVCVTSYYRLHTSSGQHSGFAPVEHIQRHYRRQRRRICDTFRSLCASRITHKVWIYLDQMFMFARSWTKDKSSRFSESPVQGKALGTFWPLRRPTLIPCDTEQPHSAQQPIVVSGGRLILHLEGSRDWQRGCSAAVLRASFFFPVSTRRIQKTNSELRINGVVGQIW